jgi:hypothetical protein
MTFPAFFEHVSAIESVDPLAALLGAADAGRIAYRYADAVRLAGHSCPTVAGAWLMASQALKRLFPDALPVRGTIRVELREARDAGTTGVVANVFSLITGAADEGGFKGLNGRFARRGLIYFGASILGDARFTRLDTGAAVELTYDPSSVPPDPAMPALMQKVMAGQADAGEQAEFGRLWQDRVRRLLLEHGDDAGVVRILP